MYKKKKNNNNKKKPKMTNVGTAEVSDTAHCVFEKTEKEKR
jgi:hypothetical protein